MKYDDHEVKVVKIQEGWFAGGYQVKVGSKTSWAFETEKKAAAAIPEVIAHWEKWADEKPQPAGKMVCHECGADFNGQKCPVCGETDMVSVNRKESR